MAIRYSKAIQKVARKVNYRSPPISDALELLMGLYAQGLGYSTLNTAPSALSAILRICDCQNFGSHSLVVRFMKGVFETRKPKPKYDVIWDASKVLTYLSTLQFQRGCTFSANINGSQVVLRCP